MNTDPNPTGKFSLLCLSAPVSFTESREGKTSFFQFSVSSFPVTMPGQECVCSAPASVMTWAQRQSLDEVAKGVMTTDLLFSQFFLVMYWYKFNTTKPCCRTGASAFDQNPEIQSCDTKLITKDR